MTEINELFTRDPFQLSAGADTDKIIAYLREHRSQFHAGIKPTKAGKAKKETPAGVEIDLKELGL